MRIVDLTLPINSKMAPLPGIPAYETHPTRAFPISTISDAQAKKLREEGVEIPSDLEFSNHMLSKLEITTHIGTHIDAPLHMLEDSWAIDDIPLDYLVRPGRVIPLDIEAGGMVTAEAIEASGVEIDGSVIPILYSGWTEKKWGTPEFWDNTVYMHKDAAELVASKGVTAVAIDFFPEFPFWRSDIERPDGQPPGHNHKILLRQNTIIIQMLTNVSLIGSQPFTLSAVPLKLEGLDGSPARVFASIHES